MRKQLAILFTLENAPCWAVLPVAENIVSMFVGGAQRAAGASGPNQKRLSTSRNAVPRKKGAFGRKCSLSSAALRAGQKPVGFAERFSRGFPRLRRIPLGKSSVFCKASGPDTPTPALPVGEMVLTRSKKRVSTGRHTKNPHPHSYFGLI